MNNDAEYLMHMTAAEKAAYNRKYYQRNKQYWVDYYKTGHGTGRKNNDLVTLGEVMSGEIQFQGKSGTRHNMVTGKAFYYDTLRGMVQPISESEAMELALNNKPPKEWSFHDFQEEKRRRRRRS